MLGLDLAKINVTERREASSSSTLFGRASIMDLREGPDANFYEITVLADMLLAIGVSLVSIFGIFFDWTRHIPQHRRTWPKMS
jgi:hypothetical protein